MSDPPSFLLVDGDRQSLETLRFGFSREGHKVLATGDFDEALRLVAQHHPRVAVLSTTDVASTERLLAKLAGGDETPSPSVLVVGPQGLQQAAQHAGAILALAKPVALRDVLSLARLLAAPTTSEGSVRVVRTTLGDVPLYDLTRALVAARRSAVLVVGRGRRFGQIAVSGGAVLSAELGDMSGNAAFEHLVLWSEGDLEVRLGIALGRRAIFSSGGDLLEQAARALQRFRDLAAALGGGTAVHEQDLARASAEAGRLPREVLPILRLCDGSRTVVDVVAESPLRRDETVRILVRLAELGLIVRREALRAQGSQPPLVVVDDWLRGRRRAGQGAGREGTLRGITPVEDTLQEDVPMTHGGVAAAVDIETTLKTPRPAHVEEVADSVVGPGGLLAQGPLAPLPDALLAESSADRIADGPSGESAAAEWGNAPATPSYGTIRPPFSAGANRSGAPDAAPAAAAADESAAPDTHEELEKDFFSRAEVTSADDTGLPSAGKESPTEDGSRWKFWRR